MDKTRKELENELAKLQDTLSFLRLVCPESSRMGDMAYHKRMDEVSAKIQEIKKELEEIKD